MTCIVALWGDELSEARLANVIDEQQGWGRLASGGAGHAAVVTAYFAADGTTGR